LEKIPGPGEYLNEK
jgi:hypothetical protein